MVIEIHYCNGNLDAVFAGKSSIKSVLIVNYEGGRRTLQLFSAP